MPVNLADFVSYKDFTTEIRKHSNSDVLVALLADLKCKRISLKEFCEQVRKQLGNGVLMKTIVELQRAQKVKLSTKHHVAATAMSKSSGMAASCSRLCASTQKKPGAVFVNTDAHLGDVALPPPPMAESEVAEFLSVAQGVGYEVFSWDLSESSL